MYFTYSRVQTASQKTCFVFQPCSLDSLDVFQCHYAVLWNEKVKCLWDAKYFRPEMRIEFWVDLYFQGKKMGPKPKLAQLDFNEYSSAGL